MKPPIPPPERTPSPSVSWLRRWYPVLVAVSVGTWLRVRGLRWQIFSDDEWHALRSAVINDYGHLLTDFSDSAAPPLPLLYKMLHDTVGLSEKIMRLPMLAFGVLLLLVFPWILPERLGPRTRSVFAMLLAISPILVYYSRYARPYSMSLFFTFVGVLAFFRWWSGGGQRWGLTYVACAALGPYFHLTALPTLLGPFAFAFGEWWLRRRRGDQGTESAGRTLRQLLGLGGFCVASLGLVLGAPLLLDWGAIAGRAGTTTADAQTFLHSLPLLAGTGRWWLVLALVTLAVIGATLLAKRWSRFAGYLLWITLFTVLAMVGSRAAALQAPIVFVRYSLWLVPVFLLFVAIAVDRLLHRLRGEAPFMLVAAAIAVACYALGPIPAVYGRVNSWTSHAVYQYAYNEDSLFSHVAYRKPTRIPEFYRQLRREPAGSLVIAEAPWFYEWHNQPLVFYQEIHRQWVKAGYLGEVCCQPEANRQPPQATRLTLRNTVNVSLPAALATHGVDYVVLHKDIRAEMPRLRPVRRRVPWNNLQPSRIPECIDRYRKILGSSVFEDRDIVVFDVRHLKTQDWTH